MKQAEPGPKEQHFNSPGLRGTDRAARWSTISISLLFPVIDRSIDATRCLGGSRKGRLVGEGLLYLNEAAGPARAAGPASDLSRDGAGFFIHTTSFAALSRAAWKQMWSAPLSFSSMKWSKRGFF